MLRTLLTRRPGKPGTKKLVQTYGESLLYVRYRYDAERRLRVKTVEIVVEEVEWQPREPKGSAAAVHVRIAESEHLLRRAVLLAGGKWEEATDTWLLPRPVATALGLTDRIERATRRPKRRSSPRSNGIDPYEDR